MPGRSCASCGAAVGVLVDRCPSCGADPDARLIELGVERAGHRRRPDPPEVAGRARRPVRAWKRWAPIGITAVILWGVFALSAGDSTDDAGGPSSLPGSPLATSSTTARSPATSTTQLVPGAPLLGERVGLQVAFISESTRIVDVDSGVLRTLPRVEAVDFTDRGLLVAMAGLGVWPAPYDGSGELVVAERPVGQAWVSADGRAVWWTDRGFRDDVETAEVVRHDLVSGTSSTFLLEPVSWPAGVAGDSLVLVAPGGTYLMGADGAVHRISSGEVVTTGGEWLLVRSCDERLSCGLQVIDANGRVHRSHPEFAIPDVEGPIGPGPGPGMVPVIAADGRLAALRSDGAGGFVVTVDGVDAAPLLEPGAMAWSPDGRWLLAMDGLELVAVDTSRPVDPIRLDVQIRVRAIWAIVVFPSPP